MAADDDFDAVWNRMSGPDEDAPALERHDVEDDGDGDDQMMDAGPPVLVSVVIAAATIPVAPWAQGWRVRAAGPSEAHVTMLFEHDIDASPVAQLAAVTGLLGTIKAAKLDLVWWAIQTRAPLPGDADAPDDSPSLEQQLSDFLIQSDEDAGSATP